MWPDGKRVVVGHPDFETLDRIRQWIYQRVGGEAALQAALPALIRDAIEFVVDPVRTARTRIGDLDNVEKTFVGLKVEHYFRDFIDVPKGVRDLRIDDQDVDVKNTVAKSWMIPPETYKNADPCVLIASAEDEGRCWLGLLVARPEYLNAPNRDAKCSISREGASNILWLVYGATFPPSRWEGIDMERFRALRRVRGGMTRAAAFFRENPGRAVHREIVKSLLFDQEDYMKRLRGNGGARDLLRDEGIVLLSGSFDNAILEALGRETIGRDEWIALAATNDTERAIFVDRGRLPPR